MDPNPQACYQPGSIINLDVKLTAHHKGHFEFRACPIAPGEVPTKECFDAYPLTFVEDVLSQGETRAQANFDVNYPERAYLALDDWELSYRYQLPPGLEGDLVLIQWYYITGNSCMAPGYDTYDWPAGGDFDPGTVPVCTSIPPDGRGVPEQVSCCTV